MCIVCCGPRFPPQVKQQGIRQLATFNAAMRFKQLFVSMGQKPSWASPLCDRLFFHKLQVRHMSDSTQPAGRRQLQAANCRCLSEASRLGLAKVVALYSSLQKLVACLLTHLTRRTCWAATCAAPLLLELPCRLMLLTS